MPKKSEYLACVAKLYQSTNPKLGLKRVLELLTLCGFKKDGLIVQVVGTNGKGSTVAFLESLLNENGISTGLFTSPHLSSVRERIRINGQMISEQDFITSANFVLSKAESLVDQPSFFEMILAMAMQVFREKKIQVIILEAGLGGRLDATTACAPDILGISTIDLDHQQILGETIKQIALEKVSAAAPGQTVITVAQTDEAMASIKKAEHDIGFKLLEAKKCDKPLGLFGEHQKLNSGLALALLKATDLKTDEKKNEQALLKTSWPGRFEYFEGEVPILFDGAHNPSGMHTLLLGLKDHPATKEKPLVVIYGSMGGDNARKKVELLTSLKPKAVILHQPENPRALGFKDLEKLFIEQGIESKIYPFEGLEKALKLARDHRAVLLVTGSLYTVGELRGELLSLAKEPVPNF